MKKTGNALKGSLDLKASQSFKLGSNMTGSVLEGNFCDPGSRIYNKQNILKFKTSQ